MLDLNLDKNKENLADNDVLEMEFRAVVLELNVKCIL